MKVKSLLFILALTVMSSSAFAQWYPVQAHVTWNQFQATAQVANHFGWPVRCQGNVYGVTQFGFHRSAWFDQIIPAGQYRVAVVGVFPGEVFVKGFANINCMR